MSIIFSILKSLAILSLVSVVAALIFSQYPFWQVFTIAIVIQFVLYHAISITNTAIQKHFYIKELDTVLQQAATVVCPCDKKQQATIPLNINGKNVYKCEACQRNVRVNINTETLLETDIIDVDQSQINMVKKFDDLLGQLKEEDTTSPSTLSENDRNNFIKKINDTDE